MGIGIAFGFAAPIAYVTIFQDEEALGIVYIGAPMPRSEETLIDDIQLERERQTLYQHLIDDPVVARRKEVAVMTPAQKQKMILNNAMKEGINAAISAGFVSSVAVYGAVQTSKTFRQITSVSSRIAPVMIAIFGSYMLANELAISDATKMGSDQFIETLISHNQGGNTQVSSGEGVELPMHEKTANWVFDYPFKTLILLSLPAVAGIFRYQQLNPAYASLKFSQKIMHTRVYGQSYVILLLAVVMGFRDYMERHGRFIPQDIADIRLEVEAAAEAGK